MDKILKNGPQIFLRFLALAVLFSPIKAPAQSSMPLLYQMECENQTSTITNPLILTQNNPYVRVARRQRVRELAYLYNQYLVTDEYVLDNNAPPAQIRCNLPSEYSQLNLSFGMDRQAPSADSEDIILFEVYLDDKLTEQRYVRLNTPESLSIPVSEATNVTLKASCLHPNWWNNCPRLSFSQMNFN